MFDAIRSILSQLNRKRTSIYLNSLKSKGLTIGENTDILEPFFLDPSHCFLISIGANCTLAPNVRLIAHDASTKQFLGYTRIGKITIDNNCFIGDSTIILPNTSIGPNTIIGAGTLVNKDIPGNVVAAGNPVRVICSIEEYLNRVKSKAQRKGVFGENYLIKNITDEKIKEMVKSLEKEEGYIN